MNCPYRGFSVMRTRQAGPSERGSSGLTGFSSWTDVPSSPVLKSPVFDGPGKCLGGEFDALAQPITGFRMSDLFWDCSAG